MARKPRMPFPMDSTGVDVTQPGMEVMPMDMRIPEGSIPNPKSKGVKPKDKPKSTAKSKLPTRKS